jgi:hypothetical protein
VTDPAPIQGGFTRLFTLEEANALIPKLAVWMTEARRLNQLLATAVESKRELARGNGRLIGNVEDMKQEIDSLSQTAQGLSELVGQINATGAEVKDLEMGLVDFPHRREGHIVYLCWKFGEDRINYWHELHTGIAGRNPI